MKKSGTTAAFWLIDLLLVAPLAFSFECHLLEDTRPGFGRRATRRSISTMSHDPFALFGSENDDEDTDHQTTNEQLLRDPANGAMAFHQGTEQALLQYVKNGLSSSSVVLSDVDLRERVLHLVDQFCRTRHWMMHVGDEKGILLQKFLAETMKAFLSDDDAIRRAEPFVLVEIGTYCGYSLIRMINTLLQVIQATDTKFHLITVDVSAENQAVAKELARLAEVDDYVSFVQLKDPERIENELSTAVQTTLQQLYPDRPNRMIDFLFIDHEKSLYLPDLVQLEQAGLVKAKSRVCADNVVVFQLDNYRQHMQKLAKQGIVETRLKMAKLEYSDQQGEEMPDGLELTVYLKDPV